MKTIKTYIKEALIKNHAKDNKSTNIRYKIESYFVIDNRIPALKTDWIVLDKDLMISQIWNDVEKMFLDVRWDPSNDDINDISFKAFYKDKKSGKIHDVNSDKISKSYIKEFMNDSEKKYFYKKLKELYFDRVK